MHDKENDEKKYVIFEVKQTVVDYRYIVNSTSSTTHPTPSK